MISSLITSQTRIRLLKKFFLNSNTSAYLRGLESEFGESTNAIRIELNRLEGAGLLMSIKSGNKKVYQANSTHPLYSDIHSIILKETGIDQIIDKVLQRIGNMLAIYLTGEFAHGRDSNVIDLILVGCNIDRKYLDRKVARTEEFVNRRVRYILLEPRDAEDYLKLLDPTELLLLWNINEIELLT